MKNLITGLCVCIAIISCSKERADKEKPGVSFEWNGKHISFDSVVVSAQPFCGQMLYSISAARNNENFLISIVTDTLRSATYQAGFNYWYAGGAITSSLMNVGITKTGASFYETSLHIYEGVIEHKF
jgi:hypothetical protein